MNAEKFEELMASIREADKLVKPHLSACHRLFESDPSYEPWKAAALKFLEQRARGEKADPTEMMRLGAEALERVYSRYFASLKKGDEA